MKEVSYECSGASTEVQHENGQLSLIGMLVTQTLRLDDTPAENIDYEDPFNANAFEVGSQAEVDVAKYHSFP